MQSSTLSVRTVVLRTDSPFEKELGGTEPINTRIYRGVVT